jgi:transposase, IS6 family
MRTRRPRPAPIACSAFAGFRFPPDVIVVAVRWYLRFGLSYRDVEELLTERGVEVDHVTVYRWVQRFAPLLAEAARPCCHTVGDRWYVDETYVGGPGRGSHRSSAGIPSGTGSAIAGGMAPHRPLRQQSGRVCPRQVEGAAATDARLKQDRSARVIIAGHAFIQNLRRGHYELAAEERPDRRVAVAFDELVLAI